MKKKFTRGLGTRTVLFLAAMWWALLPHLQAALTPASYAVLIKVSTTTSPPEIRLNWPEDSMATAYALFKKEYGAPSWSKVANLKNTDTAWTDRSVALGKAYEYQMVKITSEGFYGYGYVAAAVEAPLIEDRGKLILLVEDSVAAPLAQELMRLEQDLIGDGWRVVRENVAATASPPQVKQIIKSIYDQDPQSTKALFLFGHVPVPYSGNISPDEHENHRGAWPADVYYADLDGTWTDSTVNTRSAEKEWNWNVPGDGKFDQDIPPSSLELAVGRVDLSRMTAFANKIPSRSEIDLLRQYLDKDHRFRHRQVQVTHRALVFDRIYLAKPEPLSSFIYRNFYPIFGTAMDHMKDWEFFSSVKGTSYLFASVTSGGGYYHSDAVGTTDSFAQEEVNAVFTTFCGSYFGDWDNESSFLRAPLGANGTTLTSCYAGKPQWLFFPMAIGLPIGEAAKLSQQNKPAGLYPPFSPGAGEVHIALHGDPTLRLQPLAPPSSLIGSATGKWMALTWQPSAQEGLRGYNIYKSPGPAGPFTRLNPSLITTSNFEDPNYSPGEIYMVRAVALSSSGTASYWNSSQGIFFPDSLRQQTAETPPEAPTFLVLDELRADHITLRWLAGSANHEGFKIERKAPGETAFTEIATAPRELRSYTDSSITAGGVYSYRVRAFNGVGLSPYSNEVSGSTDVSHAEFVSLDRATSGNWSGKYGSDGYNVIGYATNLPPYFSVTTSNVLHRAYGTTDDPRALQIPGSSDRSFTLWSSGAPYGIDVSFSDGKAHRVSFYFVDWTTLKRSFRIEAWDPVRRIKLDSREISSFDNGIYLSYDVINRALFQIVPTSDEKNIHVFGFFLDPASVVAPVITPPSGPFAGKTTVSISTTTSNAEIYYTLDGSTPDRSSLRYTAPFTLGSSVVVKARAYKNGYTDSPVVTSQFVNTLITRAGFIQSDGQTRGNWRGVYGKEGYNIRLGSVSIPSYSSVAFQNAQEWYWSDNTTEERALYRAPTGDTRVAAVWHSDNEMAVDLSVIDIKSRAVSLYFLDWDRNGREQLVQVLDPDGKVLQEQVVRQFSNGLYLTFNIQGYVQIRIKRLNGNNAILSGIFFDPAPAELFQPGPIKLVGPARTNDGLSWQVLGDPGTKVCIDFSEDLKVWSHTGEQFLSAEGLIFYSNFDEGPERFYRCHTLP